MSWAVNNILHHLARLSLSLALSTFGALGVGRRE